MPDHPWVDNNDGAVVRISMTVAKAGITTGYIYKLIDESLDTSSEFKLKFSRKKGMISPDLTVGANVSSTKELLSNNDVSSRGVQLIGSGFSVDSSDLETILETSKDDELDNTLREYYNGKDILSKPRNVKVIDFYGLSRSCLLYTSPSPRDS